MSEFTVKVTRFRQNPTNDRCGSWDGWFFSKVYKVDGNKFLVYDPECGFLWQDFMQTMPSDYGHGEDREPCVELYEEEEL